MEEIQNTRKLLLRRMAVATGAGLLAVVAGLGMAPAGAGDDVKVKAKADVEGLRPVTNAKIYIGVYE